MARWWPCPSWRSDATAAEWGRRAERAAENYLTRRGLRTLERNYRVRAGEIDLVMTDHDELVFVEVRFRSRTEFGDGAASVDFRKQQRLISAARHYLQHRGDERPCRFDVVSVGRTHYRLRFEWMRNAFTP
jgi:putative endonuclease